MPPIAPFITGCVVLVLIVCAGLFALTYVWNRNRRAPAAESISPLFYLAILASIALATFADIVNHSTLLRHFHPETPGREYWSRTDALIASVPYLVLLLPAILARTRSGLLAVLIGLAAILAVPYLREAISPAPTQVGVYDDYELTVIFRIIVHSSMVLLYTCCVAGWALGRRSRARSVVTDSKPGG